MPNTKRARKVQLVVHIDADLKRQASKVRRRKGISYSEQVTRGLKRIVSQHAA